MEILILLVLILMNGVFAMSEMAVVSSRKPRLQQWADEKRRGAAAALALTQSPTHFLSTIQIGITVIGITSGAFGEATVAQQFSRWLAQWPAVADHANVIAIAVVVAGITFTSLIVGELVPKRLALISPEAIASTIARPMSWLTTATYPLVRLLSATTELVLRVLRVKPSDEPAVTEEEIEVLMDHGTRAGIFGAHERKLVSRAFRLDELTAPAIMTPRGEIVHVDLSVTLQKNLDRVVKSNHSRFPVGERGLENVRGFVSAKHLLQDAVAGRPLTIENHMVNALFVPDSISVMGLVELFKEHRETAALVVDEFGDVQGLVTLHDVMEALVGDIATVGEQGTYDVVQREDGSWLIDGSVTIHRLNEVLESGGAARVEDGADYHTLAGLVITKLGRIPVAGERLESGDLLYEVMDMDHNRVDKVLISRIAAPAPRADAAP
jgi:putative hemolysin